MHPGPASVHSDAPTGPQTTETNRQYKADLKEYMTYLAVEAHLLTQAIPGVYLEALNHDVLGFATTTRLAILTHLDTTYDTVTSDDLNQNPKDLTLPWNSTQPLEDLWTQVGNCCTFAADHNPITEAAVVRFTIENLDQSGVFLDAMKDWRKVADGAHTLANLQVPFTTADRERLRQLTPRAAGYHAATDTSAAANPAINQFPPAPDHANTNPQLQYYCWSHGLGPNPAHTSATCIK
jgi:hypothetical protein